MHDLDRHLRDAASELRSFVRSEIDVDADLAAALQRAETLDAVSEEPAPPHRPSRLLAVAAAVLLVGAVGGILLWAGRDGGDRIASPPSVNETVEPAPATTVLPATVPPTSAPAPASTDAPRTTVESGTAGTPISAGDCLTGLAGPEAAAQFADRVLTARTTGDFTVVAECLGGIPPEYTGEVPACWTDCDGAERALGAAWLRIDEGGTQTASQVWFTSLPVTYRIGDDIVDVRESWTLVPVDDGFEVTDFSVEPNFLSRDESAAVIAEYLGYIERGDWIAAAALLDDGAIDPAERADLKRLEPASFELDEIATALAAWCADGCDATVPAAGELTFTGGYSLVRGAERIEAVWFEGEYSISGLPFRRGLGPEADVDPLAGWPIRPAPAQELVPLLLPAVAVPGAETAGRFEQDLTPERTTQRYEQVWFDEDDDRVLTITTKRGEFSSVSEEFRTAAAIAPWSDAFFTASGEGFANLDLESPSGVVELWSWGLGNDVVSDVATSLTPRTGRPGWDVEVPVGLVPITEGWVDDRTQLRSVVWRAGDQLVAELTVRHGAPSTFTIPWNEASDVALATVGGAPGVVFDDGIRAAVVWSPEPDVQVLFAIRGTAEEALNLASSVGAVDRAAWEAGTTLDTERDGCTSLFC